ncbi:MAG: CRISPR-associated helicase Cas3' [Sodalinema sp.]|uniref:CRISPR-associated helicase Cas3' n=1 Tax=Sodalinema sp. TaxID=3080550 RepID=UPI00396F6868
MNRNRTQLIPDRLLAKSLEGSWSGSYSLVGHTADVVKAVTLLIDHLGDRLSQQFTLNGNLDEFKKTARLAAYFHDWGKANNHFQGVVRQRMSHAHPKRNPRVHPQLVRHEIFSMFLVWEFREWLQQADGDFLTALVVAGGHHLKLGGKGGAKTNDFGEIRWGCGDDHMRFYCDHRNFKGLLRFGVRHLGCPAQLRLSRCPKLHWSLADLKAQQNAILQEALLDWQPNLVGLALLKAILVAGDSIASAIAGGDVQPIQIEDWLEQALNCTLREADLDRIIEQGLNGNPPRPFQSKLADAPRMAIAQGGCGMGKTLGAYFWAKRHGINRKLFFCYPTTGTSTEGFLDYVQDEVNAILRHSRADVDLDLARTGEEEEAGDQIVNEAALKLRSFDEYGAKIIVATVDTVLGLMQCHRRPLYSFPAIANGAFVFDEVHCYDNRLFGALLRFLETVKAPVLLMSASFSPSQLAAIEQAVGHRVPMIPGPIDLEQQPRYRFELTDTPNWQRVEAELTAGGQVLWVCNQVSTAIEVYEEAQERGLKPLLYHSRFRYEDRVNHHRAVVKAFKEGEPVLAIATQVAEMSLDLSATLLVSQLAKPAALIQRLGRLNRRYCGSPRDALFYPDDKRFPYSRGEREQGQVMVTRFSGDVSQWDLAQWLAQQDQVLTPESDSVWLDGQWRTYPGQLRDTGVTVTALLEQDRDQFQAKTAKLNRYTVPLVANVKQVSQWERFRGYPIAPTAQWSYSREKGAVAVPTSSGDNTA